MTTGKTKKHKTHPWRAFNPGWLSSDYQRGQRVIPGHARIVRR